MPSIYFIHFVGYLSGLDLAKQARLAGLSIRFTCLLLQTLGLQACAAYIWLFNVGSGV